jgi:hypothetical protein
MTKKWYWDAILAIIASPMYVLVGIVRVMRSVTFMRLAGERSVPCRTCGRTILLVGFWKCGCGFTYRGHLLRFCPVCRTSPSVIRCEHCGATERVRKP